MWRNYMLGVILGAAAIGLAYAQMKQSSQMHGSQMALSNEQFAKQVEMQETAWMREDQAVRRRVADLRAAGLSPTLAAGNAAQTMSPIKVEHKPPTTNPLEGVASAMQLMGLGASIDKTMAQNKLIAMQTSKVASEKRIIDHDYNIIKDSGMVYKPSSLGGPVRDIGSVIRAVTKSSQGQYKPDQIIKIKQKKVKTAEDKRKLKQHDDIMKNIMLYYGGR